MPDREHITSTYGEAQRERMNRVITERASRGVSFDDRPSARFDWDRAIAGLRRILKEVYK